MKTSNWSKSWLAGWASLCALPLAAQDIASEQKNLAPWRASPEGILLEKFERAVSGSFGPTFDMDMAVLVREDGGAPAAYYLFDPARFNGGALLKPGARDINKLPGGGPLGRDAVVSLSNAGLELHSIAGGAWTFSTAAANTSSDWQNAQRIWTVQVGTTWTTFGLNAAGDSLMKGTWTLPQGTTPAAFTHVTSTFLPLLPGLLDVLFMDYDGDGTPNSELVLVRDRDLLVATVGGSPLFYWEHAPNASYDPPAPAQRSVAVSRGFSGSTYPASQRDLLCLYGYDVNTSQMQLVSFNAHFIGLPLAFSTIKGHRLSAGDYDGDGLEELFLPSAEASEVRMAKREAGATPFVFSLALGSRAQLVSGSLAASCLVDFVLPTDVDRDGDVDLVGFQSLAGPARLQMFRTAALGSKALVQFSATQHEELEEGKYRLMQVRFKFPAVWPSQAPIPTHVHVEGWIQPNGLASASELNAVPLFDGVDFDLPVSPAQVTGGGQIETNFQWAHAASELGNWVLHYHARAIVKDGNGVVTHVYPSRMAYFTPSSDIQDLLQARSALEFTAALPPVGGPSGLGSTPGGSGHQTPPGGPPQGTP